MEPAAYPRISSVPRTNPPSSLLRLLTLPSLAVVVALSGLVAWRSYRSASEALDQAAQQWLSTAVQRIGDEIEREQARADAVLVAALPDGMGLPHDLGTEIDDLRQRLWTGALLHPQDRASLSLVNESGQAATLRRIDKDNAELDLQLSASGATTRQYVKGAAGAFRRSPVLPEPARRASATQTPQAPPTPGDKPGADAREQDWYRLAMSVPQAAWTPIRLDGANAELALTRVRRVQDGDERRTGAVSTRISLTPLQNALHSLSLPAQGLAIVVERNGFLVASSSGPVLRRASDGSVQRIRVSDAGSALMSAAYERTQPHLGGRSMAQPGALSLDGSGSEALIASFGQITDASGRDWAVIVAAPRSAFTANLLATLMQTTAAALAAVALVLLIGAWVRRRLARDTLELARTVQSISDGDLDTPPAGMQSVELEPLRDGLRRLQLRLRNDRITGLSNREAVLNRLHDRMRPGRRRNDAPLLAMLFVDLDRFRSVNQQHGHEAGDFVLQTIGRRLRQTVRDSDLVARWAGDEFVLLLDGVGTPENAQRVRDQVERVLRDPVELGPGREAVELDGSVGLALALDDALAPDELLRRSEADMLQRKPTPLRRDA